MTARTPRLDDQLCFALYSASRAFTRAYAPLLTELGLTYPQYAVMLVLWEEDGLSVRALGERLQLDSGTLTPLLKRLEESGLVARARDSEDERVVRLRVTPAGKALARRAEGIPEALACRLGVSPTRAGKQRLDALRDAVRDLTRVLDGTPDAAPAPASTPKRARRAASR